METVIRTTSWVCGKGHIHTATQDLGDPADNESVMLFREEIRIDGCQEVMDSNKCCGLPCVSSFQDKTIYE